MSGDLDRYGHRPKAQPIALEFWALQMLFGLRDVQKQAGEQPFNGLVLAKALRKAAQGRGREAIDRLVLGVADALDDPDAKHELVIKASKRGRPVTASEKKGREDQDYWVARTVWLIASQPSKMTYAVQCASEEYSVSKQTVYNSLKRQALHHREQPHAKPVAALAYADAPVSPLGSEDAPRQPVPVAGHA